MDPSGEIEDLVRRATTLDESGAALATLLDGRYSVGSGGQLIETQGEVGHRIEIGLVMRPYVRPAPHVQVLTDRLNAVLSVIDGSLLAGDLDAREQKLVGWWWLRSQPMLVTAWETAVAVDDTLRNLRMALNHLPWTPADELLRDQLIESPGNEDISSILAGAQEDGTTVKPGTWALCISLVIGHWQRSGAAGFWVEALPVLVLHFPVNSDPQAASLISLIVDILFLLHLETTGDPDDDRDALLAALGKLTDLLVKLNRIDIGANLALDGAMLGQLGRASTEATARAAVQHARATPNSAQAAAGLALLASTIAVASSLDRTRRAEAFAAVEQAIEAIGSTAQPHRSDCTGFLLRALSDDPSFATLRYVASQFMNTAEPDAEIWQPRVQRMERIAWVKRVQLVYKPGSVWFVLDDARAELNATPAGAHASADWTHWTVDHPAYRRVIPHRRSFLKERAFDLNLLLLTHEVTHVLSFLGGIGMALASLRTAALASELAIWQMHISPDASHNSLNQLARHGFAPLPRDRSQALPDVAHALGLHRKAQVLQDVWAPWFEGLAVFGETSADPMHEDSVMDPVNSALANLIDAAAPLEPGEMARPKTSGDAWMAAMNEFQQRSAMAVQEHGATRLGRYLRESASPYWIGYLVVRAVVSRWRKTAGRRISGTQAFRILLHATRHNTEGAVPNLGLDTTAFSRAAEDAMLGWVQRLAELSAAEIELLTGFNSGGTDKRTLQWMQGRPVETDQSNDVQDRMAPRLRERVAEALEGSSVMDDGSRTVIPSISIDDLVLHANQTIVLGSFLPIGRCEALFHLGIDPTDGSGSLVLLLRTTDAHIDGGSSMNLFGITLPPSSATVLAQQSALTAQPRIEVTRIIDLGGLASPELTLPGLHLLAFKLGEWFELRGCTDSVDLIMRAKPGHAEKLSETVRARLYPDRLMFAERTLIAVPKFAAVRAIEWLQGGTGSDDTAEWRSRVKDLASTVLLHGERPTRQSWPLQSLARAVFGDTALAGRLASVDFQTLTQEVPEHRDTIATALFETAHGEGTPAFLVEADLALRASGCHILSSQAHGWDVVAI